MNKSVGAGAAEEMSAEVASSGEASQGKERIRVIHVTSRLNIGGLAKIVLTICRGIDRGKFDCSLITGSPQGSEGNMLAFVAAPEKFYLVPEMGRSTRLFADFTALWKLYRIFRLLRPHIVHTHASKAGVLGRLAAVAAGVPFRVHSFHGHVFSNYFPRWISSMIVLAERLLGLLATSAVVLPCGSQRREITEKYGVASSTKAHVVRYGIPVADFSQLPERGEARSKFGIKVESMVVGAIGRMVPIKNHRLLIEAFALLPTAVAGRRVELLIVGDGNCRPQIERSIQLSGIADRVHLVSWLEDLRWVYAAIDVMALTSRSEGMPIALLEAMAAGRPIISTAVGGVVDLIEDRYSGILVREQKAEEFAHGLRSLLEDEALRVRLGKNAKRHICEVHSEKEMIAGVEVLYLSLLGKVDHRPGRS